MRYLQFTIALVFFWTNSFSQKITIDQFENMSIAKFDPVNGNAPDITSKDIEKGFKIQIMDIIGIDAIKTKNAAGQFVNATTIETTTNAKLFTIINPKLEDDGNILLIKLIKGEGEKTLTLTVKASPSGATPPSIPCVPTQPKTDCKPVKGYENLFGEDSTYYDGRKIVYVYDFNKDPAKREFYKITRTKADNKQKINKIEIELKSKKATQETAKKEFNKVKSDNVKKEALLKATEDVEKQKFELKEAKKAYVLKQEVINFNKEKLTSKKNIKFKIYNINKFMYDVSIADSVIHFDSEPSALFARLFIGDSTLLGSLMGAFSENITKQSAGLEGLNNKIKCFVDKYNWLQNKVLDAYDPCYSFPCCYSIQYTELANDLSVIRADAVKIQMQIDAKKKIVEDNKKEIDACEKNEKDIKDNSAAITKCEREIKDIKQKITTLSGEEKKKKEEELAKKEEELKKIQEDKIKFDKINSDKCAEGKKDEYMKKKEAAEKELSEFSVINTLLTNLPSDKEIKQVIVFLRNMVEQNNSHTTDYISLNGNMLDLTVTITSKDSIFKYFSIPEYKNQPLRIQIPIVGKPFVSFSSGSFIATGKYLQNKTYAWQETVANNNTVDSSKYTLVESGYTLPAMGFCALGNLEWKLSRSFGLGGSAGVGLSIEKSPRLTYLGGVSLFFGDLRQFTITGGFAGMEVNKLTNNFQTIADNQTIYSSKPNIDYYKEFKVGGFISLTYTPFKVYKTKTVKSKNK